MTIFQHTIDKVKDGSKTQTSRIVKPGDIELVKPLATDNVYFQRDEMYVAYPAGENREITAIQRNGRTIWRVGGEYAAQPARCKPSVCRYRVLKLRRADVRQFSAEDIRREGFETAADFFITWCKMHDKGVILPIIPDYDTGAIVWQGVRSDLAARPAERYDAWVIGFEVVK